MRHGAFATPEFVERCFRFSVRRDRDTNRRIEAAARAAGMTITAFVQKHFETILDEPDPETGFVPGPFARRHGISLQAARVWFAMASNADEARIYCGGTRDISSIAKVSKGNCGEFIAELNAADLIHVIAKAGASKAGIYRVVHR